MAIRLQDILEIENDPHILEFRCSKTGFMLWPIIRNTFFRFIINDLIYDTPINFYQSSSRGLKGYASVAKSVFHNFFLQNKIKGPILISATGSFVVKNGQYFNRLADYFAFAAHEQTILLESLPIDYYWPFPRANNRVLFDSPLLAIAKVKSQISLSRKNTEAVTEIINYISERASTLLEWNLGTERKNFLYKYLRRILASLPTQRECYSRIFTQTGTKLLLREEGCYSSSSIINAVARECGIITAEYQHGTISSGHDVYNFANTLCANEDIKYNLPQYFLGYGKWWIDQINAPIKKIIIGNPYREETIQSNFDFCKERTDILVLGAGIETLKYLNLCQNIFDGVKNEYRVVFRPHPLEKRYVANTYGSMWNNVSIESDQDIYKAFETASIVVSEISTGLFEAIGLVDRIFLWETTRSIFAFPTHPFASFKDVDEIVKKIKISSVGQMNPIIADETWAMNWKEKYQNFIEKYILE